MYIIKHVSLFSQQAIYIYRRHSTRVFKNHRTIHGLKQFFPRFYYEVCLKLKNPLKAF